MSNGTNNPFPGYGFGFDKPMVNYNFGSGQTQGPPNIYPDAIGINYLTNFGSPAPTYQIPGSGIPPATGGGGGGGSRNPYNLSTIPMQSISGMPVTNTMQGPIGGGVEYNPPPPTTPTGGGSGIDFAGNIQSNMSAANVGNIASGVGGIIQGLVGRTGRRNAQMDAQEEYDKMRQQYLDLDTSNLYAGVTNKYRDMENAYEDLTVNQQQAQFERQMFEQQQANIMQDLAGSAGSSGIAGLAQAMANQGQIAAQRAGASIGLQESKINMLRAQEASRLQQLERAGEAQAEGMRLAGAETARGLDWRKTGTLFGMSQQELASANQAIAASDAALYGGIGQVAGTVGMMALSDRRLKKNIHLVGQSPSGLNVYNFEYIDSKYGEGLFQGAMSDEVPSNAVVHGDNYDMIDYSMIDVKFKRVN